jgi:glycosyltransferase involved in cell wall biosynthesis
MKIPTTAIVLFNYGAFGGAPKRYTNLFRHLINLYPDSFFFLTNSILRGQIKEIYPKIDSSNLLVLDNNPIDPYLIQESSETPRLFSGITPDPIVVDRDSLLPRKIYWFYKNKLKQYSLFRKIEKYRKQMKIDVFYGVFSGILPLVFYLNSKPRKAGIIFSDMDSWFNDVHTDMKKLWYRKYYSFNYALENCDYVDFLSQYILEGVKQRGVNINDDSVSISPCSFTNYSHCAVGEKKNFEIAFCSRLEPNKNPLLYLRAAKEILKKHPFVKFHLLGEGSLVREIDSFIKDNNMSGSVNFRFHVNPPEVFKESSVFVTLQKFTNYPSQSLLEAMACGNAVVASDVGDTAELVNENNGIIVPLSLDKIVEALDNLIGHKEQTLRLGIKARNDVITVHTIDRFTEYFLNLIQKAYSKKISLR